MDIDVHRVRIHLQENHRYRMPPWGQSVLHRAPNGMIEAPIANVAAIHEGVDSPGIGEADLGGGQISADRDAQLTLLQRNEMGLDARTQGSPDSVSQILRSRRTGEQHSPFVLQKERDLRVRQRQAQERVLGMGKLGLHPLHELAPGRRVEKQVCHLHPGAGSRWRVLDLGKPSPLDPHPGPQFGALFRGGERQPGNGGDRRQSLAPKPLGEDCGQPVQIPELAGRVPDDRQAGVFSGHSATVVADLDPRKPALQQRDPNRPRSGID